MAKYKIWNKKDDIYTLGGDPETGKFKWTAQEYIDKFAPWAEIPNVKVIIGGGNINGTVFMEFDATIDFYKNLGITFTDDMSDQDMLDAIDEFENRPQTPPRATAEERIAAALEFQNLLNL